MLSAKYGWVMIPRWWWMNWITKPHIHSQAPTLYTEKIGKKVRNVKEQEEFTSSQSFLWHHLSFLTFVLWPEAAIRWHERSPSHLRRCLGQRLFIFHEQNRQQVKASGEIVSHFLLILKIWNATFFLLLLNLPCSFILSPLQYLVWQTVIGTMPNNLKMIIMRETNLRHYIRYEYSSFWLLVHHILETTFKDPLQFLYYSSFNTELFPKTTNVTFNNQFLLKCVHCHKNSSNLQSV